MTALRVEFNKPDIEGRELFHIARSVLSRSTSGSGLLGREVRRVLESRLGARRIFLVPSCTAALEMAALLCNVQPGDEVVLPSFTFVSTANAFILRGAKPVFVDVRPDTLNMDETKLEAALSPRTRVIVPVHYAGVACEMDAILAVAKRRGVRVVEDAAQGVGSTYKGRACGTLGDIGTYSFHETKVFHCGEGGALSVNDPALEKRAEIAAEKGTDRAAFFRGQVDKYTWRDVGSSYLMADICAAFLAGQLERWEDVLARRARAYARYRERLAPLAAKGVGLPAIPPHVTTNHHIFFLLARDDGERTRLIAHAAEKGVQLLFHYLPLHESPYGQRFAREPLPVTEQASRRLVRLPLYNSIGAEEVDIVCDAVESFYRP